MLIVISNHSISQVLFVYHRSISTTWNLLLVTNLPYTKPNFLGVGWHKSPRSSRPPLRCRVCRGSCYATGVKQFGGYFEAMLIVSTSATQVCWSCCDLLLRCPSRDVPTSVVVVPVRYCVGDVDSFHALGYCLEASAINCNSILRFFVSNFAEVNICFQCCRLCYNCFIRFLFFGFASVSSSFKVSD